MHLERRGGPPDLRKVFEEVVLKKLHGRSLDDNAVEEAIKGKFPDFACFGDRLLIEMKHLEASQQERVDKVFADMVASEEQPAFYGSRDANLIIEAVSNGPAIKAALVSKLGRTIEGVLSKANQQFGSYRSRHRRKNSVSICVILNSRIKEYSPNVVAHAVHARLKMDQSKAARFSEIDAVLYISEKHFRILADGRAGFAMLIYEAAGAVNHPWKVQFLDRVVGAWSQGRVGGTVVPSEDFNGFELVSNIPDTMKRHEMWNLEYRRDPYLCNLSLEQLRMLFHRTVAVLSLTFLKGKWSKPSSAETRGSLQVFQDVMAETNRRGIDLRAFDRQKISHDEMLEIYADLPAELVAILVQADSAE